MKAVILGVAIAVAPLQAHPATDAEVLTLMQRTVSLFECGNLVETKGERRPFMEAGMKSGRAFLAAFENDRALYGRIWGKVDFVFFYPDPSVDFRLGAAYAALGERVTKGFDAAHIDQFRAAMARTFAEKNCALLVG